MSSTSPPTVPDPALDAVAEQLYAEATGEMLGAIASLIVRADRLRSTTAGVVFEYRRIDDLIEAMLGVDPDDQVANRLRQLIGQDAAWSAINSAGTVIGTALDVSPESSDLDQVRRRVLDALARIGDHPHRPPRSVHVDAHVWQLRRSLVEPGPLTEDRAR